MDTKKTKKKRKIFAPPKRQNRSIQVKGEWKAVDLDPELFSEDGLLEGLVCFEKLTNYRLVDMNKPVGDTKNEPKGGKKKKKRKSSEDEEGGEKGGIDSRDSEKLNEPVKKKKKKMNISDNKSTPDEDITISMQSDSSEEDEMITDQEDTPEAEPATSVLEDKPKLKKKTKIKKKKNKKQKDQKQHTNVTQNSEKRPKKQQKNWTNAALSVSEVQNADMHAWKDLFVPPVVLKALSSLGFTSPTPIQALVLPPAIRDRMDILGAAETGSGKTLAFGIPMIHNILEWKERIQTPRNDNVDPDTTLGSSTESPKADPEEYDEKNGSMGQVHDCESGKDASQDRHDSADDDQELDEGLGCVQVIEDVELDADTVVGKKNEAVGETRPLLGLVLTPTRELAVQVKHHIDAVARFTDIKTAIVVGGMAPQKQRRMLNHKPEIIIATPGRLWDLIKERHPHLHNLRQLKSLVIDEADRMVERGHYAELESLLEMLNTTYFNPKRQNFVFSATLTMIHRLPMRVLQKKKKEQLTNKVAALMEKVGIKSKPKVIDLTRKEATVETLTETQIHCHKEDKDFFLYYFLLQYPGRTMVFANSIDCIKRLNSLMILLDCTPMPLHANMHQKQRLKNLERFAERESCVLLTTDVAARGLDIPNVQHVIHYQVPRTSETYVHRSGRTARATNEGLSLLLIGPDDIMSFKKIYRNLGKDEELPAFPVETHFMEAIKERVNLARKIEKIEFYNSRQKHHNSWFRQAAEAMDIDLDEDLLLGLDNNTKSIFRTSQMQRTQHWCTSAGKGRDEADDREQQKMVKEMKKHLKHLLSQPVFKAVNKTKYPTQMGRLCLPNNLPLAGEQTAIMSVSAQRSKKKTGALQHKKREQKKGRH